MAGGNLTTPQDAGREPGGDLTGDRGGELLRGVLRRHANGSLTRTELRLALRPVVHGAQERHLPVEQLLVELKHAWGDLPEVKQHQPRHERTRQLERAVSLTIEMFYEP